MKIKIICGMFVPLFFFSHIAYGAAQNKLIAKKFKWQVAQSKHFDIYYYQGAEQFLEPCGKYLEGVYGSVTESLGVKLPVRSSFFLFLSHNDFEQNNVVDVGEGTGGVTEAFKDRFLVFNDGSQKWLKYVITHEFTHRVQFHVLYAGFWKSVRLLKSVLYPLWFMEGMAEYSTGEMGRVERDMVLRDAVTSKNYIHLSMLHGFNHVKPHQVTLAYKTGNEALNYIAREYGTDKVGLLLQDISEKFDMNSALQENIGLSISQLDAKLLESLEEEFTEQTEHSKEPEAYGDPLTAPDHLYPVFNSNPTFFPDGTGFVYLSDRGGFTELFRYDFPLSRPLALNIQKKYPEMVENIARSGSALSVSPDGRTILFAGESKQKDYIYLYDLKREKLRRMEYPLDGVGQPQISPDGKRIAFIGMKNGITDIYISRTDGKELKQLTDTFEDENSVRFFPDGETLLFSRESATDTEKNCYERDLWTLSLKKSGRETRVTSLKGNEYQPTIDPLGKEILFVNDGNGAPDLYKVSLAAGDKPVQVTQVIGGNFYPAYSPDGSEILFVSHRKGEEHIYKGYAKNFVPVQEMAAEEKENGVNAPVQAPRSSARPLTDVALWGGRPYSFRASTDFFFPILFYSSTDGLYLSAYWQASEMLGNHQMQTSVTYASAFNFLNYQVFYSYLKFRPQFFFGFVGDTQENVILTTRESRREDAQLFGVLYPLNRFDSIQLRLQTTHRRVQFGDDQFVTVRLSGQENLAGLTFSRDVSQGRYLETTSGYRIAASYEESNKDYFGSSLDYRNAFLTYHQFIPLHKESAFAFRLFGGASFGDDKQYFRTGGADLLRGFGRYDAANAGSRFIVSNMEFRFPILFDANYHIWFFFPDFLFKNIYMAVFTDNGTVWNNGDELANQRPKDIRNSFGAGLRFQTFVLQTFPVIFQFDWARRTSDGENAFYLTLGPTF